MSAAFESTYLRALCERLAIASPDKFVFTAPDGASAWSIEWLPNFTDYCKYASTDGQGRRWAFFGNLADDAGITYVHRGNGQWTIGQALIQKIVEHYEGLNDQPA